ncbi:MAG: hypothetical protein JW760_04555 [Spirochaetales bacterium]|nr:hypothetical protein [Spirochaetales bacterium]
MKQLYGILGVLMILAAFFGCATTESSGGQTSVEAPKVDVKTRVDSYDYKVLAKVDEGKLPKYVLAVVGEAAVLDEAKIDLGEVLQNEINKSGKVTLVDRNNLAAIIEEQKFALSGMSDEGSVRIGELAGADYLIITQLVSSSRQKVDKVVYDAMEAEVTLQVKLLDVSTGEVFASETAAGKASTKLVTDSAGNLVTGAVDFSSLYAQAALDAVAGIIPPFLGKFPLLGFVLKAGDLTLECDLGTGAGASVGDRIAFIRKGSPVYHPVTKNLLSYDYTYLGYGTVTEAKSASSSVATTNLLDTVKPADIAVYIGP